MVARGCGCNGLEGIEQRGSPMSDVSCLTDATTPCAPGVNSSSWHLGLGTLEHSRIPLAPRCIQNGGCLTQCQYH